jgi:hypothetical protein
MPHPLDDVEMTGCHGVESAGIDGMLPRLGPVGRIGHRPKLRWDRRRVYAVRPWPIFRPEDIDLQEGAGVAVHRVEDLPGLKVTPFVRRAIHSHLLPVIT